MGRVTLLLFITFVAITVGELPSWCDGFTDETECAFQIITKMTLDEKVGQLGNTAPAIDRLGLTAWEWWGEALHGVGREGFATVFPQGIGLGASWDPDMVHRIGDQISTEYRIKRFFWTPFKAYGQHGLSLWAPNVNVFRDPRWGRGPETYGEDPFLCGTMGANFISGIQGPDAPRSYKAIATPKHFAVHSGPEPMRHTIDLSPTPFDFEDTYMPAFRQAVIEGKAGSIMCSYNSVYGKPACAQPLILDTKLRQDWGFTGYVVSDCDAIADEVSTHKWASSYEDASAKSVMAGTDLDCGGTYSNNLAAAVKNGSLEESYIDRSLLRLFLARLRTHGDPIPPYNSTNDPGTPDDNGLALEAARKAIVLLKNDGILPLKSGLKVAVIGPTSDLIEDLVDSYRGIPQHPITPLTAAYTEWGQRNVLYAQGSTLVENMALSVPRTAFRTSEGLQGLDAEYYNNTDLSGAPLLFRIDPNLDLDQQDAAPAPGLYPHGWSARWKTTFTPPGDGDYKLGVMNDGGNQIKITMDGQVLFDVSGGHEIDIHLKKRSYQLELEYSFTGGSRFRLQWQPPAMVQLKEAVVTAEAADVIIAFVGLSPSLESEENGLSGVPGFYGGDRTSVELPERQKNLLTVLGSLNKPIVVVLTSGSAVAINWANENANAALANWYGGESGGKAIIGTLVGRYNPGGRSPVTFYASDSDLPAFDDYSMEGRTYRYFKGQPLYAFGHGLSYTTFNYTNVTGPKMVQAGSDMTIQVTLLNSGNRDGEEVIQVYLKPVNSPTARPLNHQLAGFSRVSLKASKKSVFSITIKARQLSLVDADGQRAVRAGDYELHVGGGQPGFYDGMIVHRVKVSGNAVMPA